MKESKLPKYNENNIVKDDKNIIYRIKNQLILDGLNSIKSVDTTLDEICIGTILSEEDNNENMNLLPDAVSHMIKNIRITINGWYADIEIMNTAIKNNLKLKIQIYKSKKLVRRLKDVYYYILDYGENCYPRIHIIVRRKPNIDIDTFIDNINTLQKFDYDNTDISVFWMDKDISERLNKKERQEDKDLLKRFNDIQSNLIKEADDPENDEPRILIETNVK